MSQIVKEGFAQFSKRQQGGPLLENNDLKREQEDLKALHDVMEKRFARKYKLFYDNLDLIIKHQDEIIATPRYANIDAHYLISGGGCWVGSLATARQLVFAGSVFTFNLKLGTVLKAWKTEPFRCQCECGETAFVRSFAGSPLSGSCNSRAYCPKCKKLLPQVRDCSFGNYFWYLQDKMCEDIEMVVNDLTSRWSHAQEKFQQEIAKRKLRNSSAAIMFRGSEEFCSLETMLQELRLKDFNGSTKQKEA